MRKQTAQPLYLERAYSKTRRNCKGTTTIESADGDFYLPLPSLACYIFHQPAGGLECITGKGNDFVLVKMRHTIGVFRGFLGFIFGKSGFAFSVLYSRPFYHAVAHTSPWTSLMSRDMLLSWLAARNACIHAKAMYCSCLPQQPSLLRSLVVETQLGFCSCTSI